MKNRTILRGKKFETFYKTLLRILQLVAGREVTCFTIVIGLYFFSNYFGDGISVSLVNFGEDSTKCTKSTVAEALNIIDYRFRNEALQ